MFSLSMLSVDWRIACDGSKILRRKQAVDTKAQRGREGGVVLTHIALMKKFASHLSMSWRQNRKDLRKKNF